MKELVGSCLECGTNVFCHDGFINGVVTENGVICFACHEKKEQAKKAKEENKSSAEE